MKIKYFKIISIVLGIVLLVLIKKLPHNQQFTSCQGLNSNSLKLQCWEDQVEASLNSQGIDKAFEVVQQLYKTDPVFASNCHDFVHLIGEKAYKLFSLNKDFNLSAKTSFCGYGFYHAFMETLVSDGGDLNKAGLFCDYVDEKLKDQNDDAKGACFHGIGHGVADNHDQQTWENEAQLVSSALTLCEKVAPDQVLLNRCSSGVFNVLALAYNAHKLPINSNDPLWFCHQLGNAIYKKTCYEEMNTALFILSGKVFPRSAKFIEAIKEDEFALSGIRSLAGVFGMSLVQNENFDKFISDCRKLQERLGLSCIKGFAAGLIEGGSPGQEYLKALKFCESEPLNEVEKRACFEEALRLSSLYYPKEKHQLVCSLVDTNFRKGCL